MTEDIDILDKYEFTDDNGDPLPPWLMNILKNPSEKFGFTHELEPDYMYEDVRDILEETELTKGEITILKTFDSGYHRFYSVDGGEMQTFDADSLMVDYDTVRFELKK